jgi:hypothetical protein
MGKLLANGFHNPTLRQEMKCMAVREVALKMINAASGERKHTIAIAIRNTSADEGGFHYMMLRY